MEPIFCKEFTVNDLYVDCFGRLKLSAALFLAQEVAGHHCLELGLDWDTLAQKNLFWAVIRHRVQIHRLPRRGDRVTVRTWPLPTTRTAFPRAMEVLDQGGNVLLRTMSLWILMDLNTRAMILPGKSGVLVPGTTLGTELGAPRSIVPKTLQNHMTRPVLFSDLDRNGHMNNTRYLDWVQDLLPSGFHQSHEPKELTVCYLNESREGQTLDLRWEIDENGAVHVDATREKERVFAAQILY
jgi:medium-chain acyl-[acyl-carrier-protein] hydrolase